MTTKLLTRRHLADRQVGIDLIPDRQCQHGERFRICTFPCCIEHRAGILRRALKWGWRL